MFLRSQLLYFESEKAIINKNVSVFFNCYSWYKAKVQGIANYQGWGKNVKNKATQGVQHLVTNDGNVQF
jgi:hypothetical protein